MGEFLMAKRLQKDNKNWAEIARQLGRTVEKVRGALDYNWADRKRSASYRNRQKERNALKCPTLPELKNIPPGKPIEIPASVIEDREHRFQLKPRDLTAFRCGDPLPGYSALDMKNNALTNR